MEDESIYPRMQTAVYPLTIRVHDEVKKLTEPPWRPCSSPRSNNWTQKYFTFHLSWFASVLFVCYIRNKLWLSKIHCCSIIKSANHGCNYPWLNHPHCLFFFKLYFELCKNPNKCHGKLGIYLLTPKYLLVLILLHKVIPTWVKLKTI